MTQETMGVPRGNGHAWKERSRVVLTPVAAPAILGWFSFAAAAFLIGSHLAGWWGVEQSMLYLAPFVGFLGLCQLLAGMWAYRARQPIATAMHSIWGAFWLGIGIVHGVIAFGALELTAFAVPFGFWFLAAGLVTLGGVIAAARENVILTAVLGVATLAAIVMAIGFMAEVTATVTVGGWLMVVAAALGWYFATAMMMAEASGRTVLPVGRYHKASELPGEPMTDAVAFSTGLPLEGTPMPPAEKEPQAAS